MSNLVNKRIRSTDLNGRKLTIKVLGATQGTIMANKLVKAFLPVYRSMLNEDGKVDILAAAELAAEKMSEIEINKIISALFAEATIEITEGAPFPLNTDEYFAANYGELVDALKFAIVENFGSFINSKVIPSLKGE